MCVTSAFYSYNQTEAYRGKFLGFQETRPFDNTIFILPQQVTITIVIKTIENVVPFRILYAPWSPESYCHSQ